MFVFVRVHISDEVFLLQILTFLENVFLLYSLVSYQDVYHNGLHQSKCYS